MPKRRFVCPCPTPECASTGKFMCWRIGFFTRVSDGRRVQRFQCRNCKRTFSTQTDRIDYRLHKPLFDRKLYRALIASRSQRQAAKVLGWSRKTVALRLKILAPTRPGRDAGRP